jgi:hypothetical protein
VLTGYGRDGSHGVEAISRMGGYVIGAARRSNESIPCNVLKIDGTLVEVETEEPTYRRFSLWVASSWIDGKAGPSEPHFMRQSVSGARRDLV